jgi:hypothetical protein
MGKEKSKGKKEVKRKSMEVKTKKRNTILEVKEVISFQTQNIHGSDTILLTRLMTTLVVMETFGNIRILISNPFPNMTMTDLLDFISKITSIG